MGGRSLIYCDSFTIVRVIERQVKQQDETQVLVLRSWCVCMQARLWF